MLCSIGEGFAALPHHPVVVFSPRRSGLQERAGRQEGDRYMVRTKAFLDAHASLHPTQFC